jgi:hypothetical protein
MANDFPSGHTHGLRVRRVGVAGTHWCGPGASGAIIFNLRRLIVKGMKTMRLWTLRVGTLVVLLSLLASGCSKEDSSVLGRWEVIDKQGINVPNSFFWFSMDYLEFREDGTVLALVKWTPGVDVRLNKTARYSLVGERQIEFVGACRYQDPCTGVYTMTLSGDRLQIFDADGILTLTRIGPPGKGLPPRVVGPSPSPTPAVTE